MLALGFAIGCGGEPPSEEDRIRTLIAETRAAAEAADVARVKAALSKRFVDGRGNDRRQLAAWITMQRMRQDEVYLWVNEETIELQGEGSARAVLVVGMAGTPIERPGDLAGLAAGTRTGVWRAELDFALEDGEWRVVRADWRRASPRDLL